MRKFLVLVAFLSLGIPSQSGGYDCIAGHVQDCVDDYLIDVDYCNLIISQPHRESCIERAQIRLANCQLKGILLCGGI